MPPVHGEQGALRLEGGHRMLQRLLQILVPEVVQDLGEHDEVEAAVRPPPGDIALLDPDMGQVLGAPGRGLGGSRGDVAGQHLVAARGEHPGEDPDGAAGFESAAVPGGREQRQADRVLALLVPAVLEAPRVGRGLVHGVEIARRHGHRGRHRSSTSSGRVKCATIPGGSTGPAAPSRPVSWLANAPIAAFFFAATSALSVTWQACGQGTRRSPGLAQCHIQIG